MFKEKLVSGGVILITGKLMVVMLLLTNLSHLAFDLDYYKEQYQRLNRPEALGISEGELLQITGELIAYLRGQRADLDIFIEGSDEQVAFFSPREIEHMADVRILFHGGIRLRRWAVVGLLLLLGWVGHRKNPPWQVWAKLLKQAAGLAVVGLVLGSVLIYLWFDYWFAIFHLVSFTNDLWILDPAQHNLIKMVPQEFFYATTVNFTLRTLLQLVFLLIVAAYLEQKLGKAQADLRAGHDFIP